MTDEELLQLVGKPYTRENERKMIYGGRIDTKGIIVDVKTSKDNIKCKRSFFSLFF
jgi:hypothetical protein